MKQTLAMLLLSACLLPLPSHAQLNNGGLYANFGVDADTRTNWLKYGTVTGAISSDDWFAPSGTGNNVIDTSGAATYLALLQAGNNISFMQRMSALLYTKVGGTLWLDGVYGRDFTAAANLKDSTTFTGAAKNGDDPNIWTGGVSSFPNKNDLVDVYGHMRRDGVNINDSLWLFTGVSLYGTRGASYFDVELYKAAFSYNPATFVFTSAGPDAGHTQWLFDASGNVTQTGDLIIAVTYTPGTVPVVDVRIWVSQTTLSTVSPSNFSFTGAFNGATASPTFGYASIVSKSGTTAWGAGISNYSALGAQDTTYSTPWGTGVPTGGPNWGTQYQSQQFMEVGLNLTRIGLDPALYATLSPCQALFSKIFFKTRSSASFTASMHDFMTPLDFVRNPVMDYSLQPDTLRCNHTVANITLKNNSTAGYFTWKTLNGNISGSNADSSQLSINQPGTYVVSASPNQGCPVTRTDTVVIPIDTFPPVATATAAESGSQLYLAGGNFAASNYSTPFGGSAGLTFSWNGPNSFASTLQNPVTDTVWGTYKVTVTEARNGCTDTASVTVNANTFVVMLTNDLELSGTYRNGSVDLHWTDLNETTASMYAVERMDTANVFRTLAMVSPEACLCYTDHYPFEGESYYRVKGITHGGAVYYSPVITVANDLQNIYLAGNGQDGMTLVAQMAGDRKGALVVFDMRGQTLQKRSVYFTKGTNTVALPANWPPSLKVVVLFVDGRIAFSTKALF